MALLNYSKKPQPILESVQLLKISKSGLLSELMLIEDSFTNVMRKLRNGDQNHGFKFIPLDFETIVIRAEDAKPHCHDIDEPHDPNVARFNELRTLDQRIATNSASEHYYD